MCTVGFVRATFGHTANTATPEFGWVHSISALRLARQAETVQKIFR